MKTWLGFLSYVAITIQKEDLSYYLGRSLRDMKHSLVKSGLHWDREHILFCIECCICWIFRVYSKYACILA